MQIPVHPNSCINAICIYKPSIATNLTSWHREQITVPRNTPIGNVNSAIQSISGKKSIAQAAKLAATKAQLQ